MKGVSRVPTFDVIVVGSGSYFRERTHTEACLRFLSSGTRTHRGKNQLPVRHSRWAGVFVCQRSSSHGRFLVVCVSRDSHHPDRI